MRSNFYIQTHNVSNDNLSIEVICDLNLFIRIIKVWLPSLSIISASGEYNNNISELVRTNGCYIELVDFHLKYGELIYPSRLNLLI